MPGDGIGPEVTKGSVRVIQAKGVEFHRDLAFASDKAHNIYDTPLLLYFSGSIARNGIALKDLIVRSSFSGLASINMASRKYFDKYPCFHPRNISTGAYTFHSNIISQLCTGLIGGLVPYVRTNPHDTKAADRMKSTILQVKAEGKSLTCHTKYDRDDTKAVSTSYIADAMIPKMAE